ncbi:nuclear transport factor 2 family protein [Halieaceae bacterium]|jgi:limonene-1,2-epoxide hydrolase|nr:nuclear transport factor 2 family protein [Halieaceae bacterium]
MSNQAIVEAFFEAISRNQKEEILSFFTEETIYHNIPVEAVKGLEGIWSALSPIHDICGGIEWVVHHIAEDPQGNVLTERNDRFEIGGKWLEIPVMGIFELSDGKITGWRDYFDMKQVTDKMAG